MKKLKAVIMGIVLAGGLGSRAEGAVKTESVVYLDHGKEMQGYFAWDDSISGKRPAVLIVHDWRGHGPYVRMRAEQLAKLGYLAFACDIYGKGIYAEAPAEASKLATSFRDNRVLMRQRVNAGLDRMKENKLADTANCAAIGYCFGGTTVLELIRSAADIQAAVIFHGSFDAKDRTRIAGADTKVLICQGALDKRTIVDLPILQEELTADKLDWEVAIYSGAAHSFTIKEAGNDPSTGSAYNENADRRSWEAMKDWFAKYLSNNKGGGY